jgi:cephalosporin hydroxylase
MIEEIADWITNEIGVMDRSFGGAIPHKTTRNFKLQQRPLELASLIKFLLDKKSEGEQISRYIEIGACAGGTTYTINEFLKFEEILIIDDAGAENTGLYVNERGDHDRGKHLAYINRIEIIGDSKSERIISAAKDLSRNNKFDVLFIDGDHSVEGVRNDAFNYYDCVRDGGYLVFHDTIVSGSPDIVCEELVRQYPSFKFISTFAFKDPHVNDYPNGIGISVYQK